jgi:hypothetical protein
MANQKYYAVFKGFKPGIYSSWHGEGQAEEQVSGFFGSEHKRFFNLKEAEKWLDYKKKGQKPMSAGEADLASIAEMKGYAVTLMLQPNHGGAEAVMLIGSAIYNVDSKKLAKSKIMDEFWTPEHDKLGKPLIEATALDIEDKPAHKPRRDDSDTYGY